MEKLNMANMNTLFRKGYLLAGVMMAANMFVVNEVMASENMETKDDENAINSNLQQTEPQNNKDKVDNKIIKIPVYGKKSKKGFFNFVLTYENAINLIGGLALSGANNYFKWWDYNAGGYLNLRIGCLGWRSKRLLDIFQFEVNLNLGRGISWSIPHIINLIMTKRSEKGKKDGDFSWSSFFFKDILRGFTSMPLTLHISNFSISISLDSMIWSVIGKILESNGKKKLEEIKNNEGEKMKNLDPNLINIPEGNLKNSTVNEGEDMLNNLSQKTKKEVKKEKDKNPIIIKENKEEDVKPNNMNNDPTSDKKKN